MKKILLFISMVCFFGTANAQEEAIFNHYHINPLLINPGTAGFDKDNHKLFMNVRNQWAGFTGAPETYSISYNGPIGKTLGLGAMIFTENIASLTRYRMQFSYAFRYDVRDVKMGIGMSTEFHRMRLAASATDSPFYDFGDAAIEEAIDGIRTFDASLGVYAELPEGTYLGLSLPNLIRNRLDEIAGTDGSSLFKYYMFNLGHRFKSEQKGITVEPSILIKKVRNVPFQVDLNAKAGFLDDKVIGGLTYRTGHGGSFGVIVGTRYKNLQLYYTYDAYMGEFQQYSTGSHEFTLNFDIEKKKGKFDRSKKYRN